MFASPKLSLTYCQLQYESKHYIQHKQKLCMPETGLKIETMVVGYSIVWIFDMVFPQNSTYHFGITVLVKCSERCIILT